jgi:hypothetical protein
MTKIQNRLSCLKLGDVKIALEKTATANKEKVDHCITHKIIWES